MRTDAAKMTTVAGVYTAGDAAQMLQNATLASVDGVLAGVSLRQYLAFLNGTCRNLVPIAGLHFLDVSGDVNLNDGQCCSVLAIRH